jgi:hypothetical protein
VYLRPVAKGQKTARSSSSATLAEAARRVAPCAGLDPWTAQEAKNRLVAVCRWLDTRLRAPVRVTHPEPGLRQVTLLGCIVYQIDFKMRAVFHGYRVSHRLVTDYSSTVELGRPLITSAFVEYIVAYLGLPDCYADDLLVPEDARESVMDWIADTTYRLLGKHPGFVHLRRMLLPRALNLPRDLYGIALAARPQPIGPLLSSKTFNVVWKHETVFRQVARENPHLLPLLFTCLNLDRLTDGNDPVAALKATLMARGISEPAWRYVDRHGSRLFRTVWRECRRQNQGEAAINYLAALDAAGLPPPPPPRITRAWLHGFCPHTERHNAVVDECFRRLIAPDVLNVALREADRRRYDAQLDDFVFEFVGVGYYASATKIVPDRNQKAAGWPWLLKRWRAWEAEQQAIAEVGDRRWSLRIQPFRFGAWKFVPIGTSAELVQESLAMRNCLWGFVDSVDEGLLEVLSVRDAITGKRVACMAFEFHDDGEVLVNDVKAFANTPPPPLLDRVSHVLRQLFADAQMGAPWIYSELERLLEQGIGIWSAAR